MLPAAPCFYPVLSVPRLRDIAAYASRLIMFRDGRVKSDERQAVRNAVADLATLDAQPAAAQEGHA